MQKTYLRFHQEVHAICKQKESGVGPFKNIEGKIVRKLNCTAYDDCLNFAANKDWQTFTCDGCALLSELSKKDCVIVIDVKE